MKATTVANILGGVLGVGTTAIMYGMSGMIDRDNGLFKNTGDIFPEIIQEPWNFINVEVLPNIFFGGIAVLGGLVVYRICSITGKLISH
jgi:hypothetical protein